MKEVAWVNIVLLFAVVVFAGVLIGRNAEHYEAVIAAKDREIAELRDHIDELKMLSRHIQHPTVCIETEDMTAREFLWHLRELCDEYEFEIH